MSASIAEPQRLGPYRLVERLGEGGMGVVHLAVGPAGDLVAVKVLRPWLVGGQDGRARFSREVATLRRVRGARVAEVVDADVEGDPPYVVTRYVRGAPLDRVVADHGPLQAGAVARLATGLAESLASVHAAGVVHRDVKPGNVLMTDTGPVLIDFGLARAVDETRLTATGLVIGTPGYLAPETVDGEEPTPATDVHGWATTVTFAATGRAPYGTGPDAAVLDRIRRGQHDLAGVDPDLAALLHRALAVEPERRPTVAEIHNRLAGPDPDATSVEMPSPVTAPVPLPAVSTRVDLQVSPTTRPAGPSSAPVVAAVTAPAEARGRSAVAVPPAQRARPSQAPAGRPLGEPASLGMARPLREWPARVAVAAAALAMVMLFGVAPYLGALVLFAVTVLARTAWRTRWRLNERRLARGTQRGDRWVTAIGSPWDLVVVSIPALAQTAWVCLCGFVVGAAVDLSAQPSLRLPYLAGGAVALLLVWLGPGTARVRYGVRLLTGPLDRDARWAWSVAGLFLALTWALVLWWDAYGTSWFPGTGPPNPLGI
ncbi:MAG TPA: protein kinase [Jiangellaceae bacterium]|nr:protein kinase [Jiangellaceae bacterium]